MCEEERREEGERGEENRGKKEGSEERMRDE